MEYKLSDFTSAMRTFIRSLQSKVKCTLLIGTNFSRDTRLNGKIIPTYIYMCICIYVYIYFFMEYKLSDFISAMTTLIKCLQSKASMYMCICICTYVYICIYILLNIYKEINNVTYTYTYMYIYIYNTFKLW
jgi:hypothetical protein